MATVLGVSLMSFALAYLGTVSLSLRLLINALAAALVVRRLDGIGAQTEASEGQWTLKGETKTSKDNFLGKGS